MVSHHDAQSERCGASRHALSKHTSQLDICMYSYIFAIYKLITILIGSVGLVVEMPGLGVGFDDGVCRSIGANAWRVDTRREHPGVIAQHRHHPRLVKRQPPLHLNSHLLSHAASACDTKRPVPEYSDCLLPKICPIVLSGVESVFSVTTNTVTSPLFFSYRQRRARLGQIKSPGRSDIKI